MLTHLVFYVNRMGGTIPPDTSKLVNLHKFYVGFNEFTGPLPVVDLSANLVLYGFNNNRFTGSIPSLWSNHISALWLQDNYLTGTLPNELGTITNLAEYVMFNNHISGSVPSILADCSRLEYWAVYGNCFLNYVE